MFKKIYSVLNTLRCLRENRGLNGIIQSVADGRSFAKNFQTESIPSGTRKEAIGRLRQLFDSKHTGNGILKWLHYLEIYERHFSTFVDTDVTILEIGVYSGGSMEMWRSYFGAKCRIFGVDIEPACRQYANEYTQILIGDQGDPNFWDGVCKQIPQVDIILDDGGHTPEQQRCTLEHAFQLLKPGGVYVCEDIHGLNNQFAAYCAGMIDELNQYDSTNGTSCKTSAFQATVKSICFYPFLVVVEKNSAQRPELNVERKGTIWQPFLGS